MKRIRYAAALLLALSAAPAFATGEIESLITQADRDRLAKFDETRAEALQEARDKGSAGDVATLDAVANAAALPFDGFDMTGNWQCRTIKAGGLAGLVVYGWFKCRVTDDGGGWTLEKLSGSQRTKGRFFTESDTRLTYLGSFFIAGDTPARYGSGPDTDQSGYAIRTGADAFRIELPAPRYESKLDILELRRTR